MRLTLQDGATLTIAAEDVTRVCKNLWLLTPKEDAVFLYGVVMAESRNPSRIALELTGSQTALMRQAVSMHEAP